MNIHPQSFLAKPGVREFVFQITAKKGADSATCKILDVGYLEEAPETDSDDPPLVEADGPVVRWTIKRKGAGAQWILVCDADVVVPTVVHVFATGPTQVSAKMRILPDVMEGVEPMPKAEPAPEDDRTPKLATLTPTQKALYELAKLMTVGAVTTTAEDFAVLEKLDLVESTPDGWKAVG
jgi:hypothetical protein